jgi:hypothetical protein
MRPRHPYLLPGGWHDLFRGHLLPAVRQQVRAGSRRRRVELRKFNPPLAARNPHHGDVGPDALEPDGAIRPRALDLRLPFQIHTEFGKERDCRLKILDHNEDVVHPL